MFEGELVPIFFILALVCAHPKDVNIKSTSQKPEPQTRFFGLENILGQIFHGPGRRNQHHQPQYNDWQHMQSPDQAQSLDQHLHSPQFHQGGFSNNFGPGPNQNPAPVQFPNQQSNFNQYPTQSQGNNGNNLGQNQNFNTGTLDDIPLQNGNHGNWSPENQFQNQNGNQMVQNQGNQFPNQNGNQMAQNQGNQFPNQNWNQMAQNQGNQFPNQNGNQMLQNQENQFPNQNGNQWQNQNTQGDYNPAAILGKPVAMTTSVPDSIVFQDGCDTPTQRQCVQDCQSSSEYRPLCGSNNVTYYNHGRFICARNCGVNVFVQREGKCKK